MDTSPETRYRLAYARFAQARYIEALKVLTPDVVEELPVAALLRIRCEHAIRRPAPAFVVEGVARALRALVGREERVSGILDDRAFELLSPHPDCGRTWISLALTETRHLEARPLERDSKIVSRYSPAHVGSWHVVGWVQLLLGNTALAWLAFERALPLAPNLSETRDALAVVAALYQGRFEQAQALLEAMMARPAMH